MSLKDRSTSIGGIELYRSTWKMLPGLFLDTSKNVFANSRNMLSERPAQIRCTACDNHGHS